MQASTPNATASTTPAAPRERIGLMELGGKPATLIGDDVLPGQRAPRFQSQVGLWAGRSLWSEVDALEATAGLVRIVTAVPSLDTDTCDTETRRFNVEAALLGPGARVITVSVDLPVTQKRWCDAAGVENVYAVSDHMGVEFGIKYGCLMKERRWLRRAVFVLDHVDVIHYAAYMTKLGDQPNYKEVLAVARQLLEPPPETTV